MKMQRIVAGVVGLVLMGTAAMAQTYAVSVSPSLSTVKVGDCLYFSGTVTLNGKAASGVKIGVEDPMKQQSIANVATTDSKGKFTYYPENMCPAKFNDMVGSFEFKFFAGSTTAKSKVTVGTKPSNGLDLVTVNNTSKSSYKVRLQVDGVDKGTTTVAAGKNLSLFNSSAFNNSTIIATIMDNSNKTLWKATYKDTPRVSPKTSTMINPYYNNFFVNSTVTLNGTSKTRSFSGVGKLYDDYVNKQYSVGGLTVNAESKVRHGVSTEGQLGITGPGCETFLGLRASCSLSCSASAGLFVCVSAGAESPISALADIGCGLSCCVEVATVSCQVASIGDSVQATYK